MIKTVYERPRHGGVNVHHPEATCPDRMKLDQEGKAIEREKQSPGQAFDALDRNRRFRNVSECDKCRLIRGLREMGQL